MTNRKRDMANKVVSRLKEFDRIAMQDEQLANWHKGMFGRKVQHSCLGLLKAKLRALPQTVVLSRWIPTTRMCPQCGRIHDIGLADREFACECGRRMDRDVHSAKNMLALKDLVLQVRGDDSVPTEHREITLGEFKAAVGRAFGADGKPGR